MKRHELKAAVLSVILTITLLFAACGKGSETTVSGSGSKSTASASASKTSVSASVSEEPEKEPDINYTMTLYADWLYDGHPLKAIVDAYNKAYPNQGIEITSPGFEEINDATANMAVSIAEGGGADILALGSYNLKQLYDAGCLAPLDTVFEFYDIGTDVIPAVLEEGTIDGRLIGIAPFIASITGCVVSEELYDDKNWSVKEILSIMETHPELERICVTDKGKVQYVTVNGVKLTAAEYHDMDVTWRLFSDNLRIEPFLDIGKKKADYNCEDFVKLLERLAKDMESTVTSVDINKTGKYLTEYFVIPGLPELTNLLGKYPKGYNFVGIPGVGNKTNASSFICVNVNCQNKEAVADFIEFAVSAEGQQAMGTEAIPVRKDPSEFISSGDPGFRTAYEDFMMGLKANSVSEDGIMSEIFMILRPEIENYLNTRDEDPNAVARRIQQKVQEYLDGLE